MKTAEKICELLMQKKAAFEEYEGVTRLIWICPIDDIEAHMDTRGAIITRINEIDAQIALAAANDPALLEAARNSVDRGGLPEEAARVYDAGAEIFAVASRVRRAEELAVARVREEHDDLEEKIRKNNTSMQAYAARYFDGIRTIGGSPDSGFGLGKA